MKTKTFEIKKSPYKNWEEVFNNPGAIQLEVLHTGDVFGTVSGLINFKNPTIKEFPADVKLKAPLFSHLLRHEKYGDFIIDAGFDHTFSEVPWGGYEGLLKKKFKFALVKGMGIEAQLAEKQIRLSGVFCTHFHEHQGGAKSLPHDIPYVYGKGEKELSVFPLIYTRFLKDKTKKQTIDFMKAEDMPIVGKAVDIFGDGSLWAISTPGHTKGHISWLVNGKAGAYMIIGDTCMSQMSYELGIESGGVYAYNLEENAKSFSKIKTLIETYPKITPVFGHESKQYRIYYLPQ